MQFIGVISVIGIFFGSNSASVIPDTLRTILYAASSRNGHSNKNLLHQKDIEIESTSTDEKCRDKFPVEACTIIKSKGLCPKYEYEWCQNTCGFCKSECRDIVSIEVCTSFKSHGDCPTYVHWCQKTCGFCELEDSSHIAGRSTAEGVDPMIIAHSIDNEIKILHEAECQPVKLLVKLPIAQEFFYELSSTHAYISRCLGVNDEKRACVSKDPVENMEHRRIIKDYVGSDKKEFIHVSWVSHEKCGYQKRKKCDINMARKCHGKSTTHYFDEVNCRCSCIVQIDGESTCIAKETNIWEDSSRIADRSTAEGVDPLIIARTITDCTDRAPIKSCLHIKERGFCPNDVEHFCPKTCGFCESEMLQKQGPTF